jgi:hypothetical protein
MLVGEEVVLADWTNLKPASSEPQAPGKHDLLATRRALVPVRACGCKTDLRPIVVGHRFLQLGCKLGLDLV